MTLQSAPDAAASADARGRGNDWQDEPEYYSVGHDDAATVIPEDLLSTSQPEIACILAGVGDARNLLATVFFTCLLELSPEVALGNGRSYHFTLVDLKPAVFARDLLIFRLAFELAISSRQDPKAVEEIEVTLSYLFAAQVMPKWVSDQLQACISAVLEDLRDSTRNVLGLFYIPEPFRERIIRVLLQWTQTPESWYTARSLRRAVSIYLAEQKRSRAGRTPSDGYASRTPPGCDARSPDMIDFEDLSVILPPAHLMQKHEPQLWDLFSTGAKPRTATTRKALGDYFDSAWQPNVTMVDLDFERKREDGPAPHMAFTPNDVVHDLFANVPAHLLKRGPGLLNHLRGFFWLIGPPLAMMQSRLVVEIVIGEMVDTFERLRHGLLRQDWKAVQHLDPAKFPQVDYIGGPLTTFLHGLPLLRDQRVSRMRSYVIRNTPVWKTHSAFLAEHLLLAKREHITSHFRTPLKQQSLETEQENSGRIVNGGGVVMSAGYEWEPTSSHAHLAPETRMTRGELERWLHSHFLKLCLPFPRIPGDILLVYAPLGMASYFSLVSHVATLGYPAHWLAGILATLCRGVLARSRAGPPTAEITIEKMATRLWPVKDVCVAPFVAEFRTLLATWEPVLGFPMVDANSDELLLPQREAIRRYTIQFPLLRRGSSHLSTSAFVLVLKARSCEVLGGNLRRLLDDRTGDSSPAACTARMEPRVHVVSATTWKVDTATASFWMDKGVMDNLTADGSWEAWIWRTDTWRAVLGPAPLHGEGVSAGESWC